MVSEPEEKPTVTVDSDAHSGQVAAHYDHSYVHRQVGDRQIQLFAIGGSIGTGLFVAIGTGLYRAGPAGLLLAFIFQSCLVGLANSCMAEMSVHMPLSGGFVRHAGKWVDEALGFSGGVNFFCQQAFTIPFEITALCTVLEFWRDDIPPAAVITTCIALYLIINIAAVKYYAETEFWLSLGKVILFFIFFFFTFITMVGGNPQHDAYGFRYWVDPGPFEEYISTGNLGKFEGFLGAIFTGSLFIVGPEYISMIAGEAKRPRVDLKKAYKTIYWRFGFFFIGGALCVGIVLPSNDPSLVAFVEGASGSGTAAASPYVIAMTNLNISVLPHIVNALLLTSIFSAGNTFCFTSTRILYGMALEGQAPKFMKRCTKSGIPIYCLGFTMLFALLSFLQLSNSGSTVLTWLINLMVGGILVNFIVMCITYLRFYYACKAQGLDRRTLPYRGWFQPYSAWIALVLFVTLACIQGYAQFLPGGFTPDGFLTTYLMVIIAPFTYSGWKLFSRTKIIKTTEVDLAWMAPDIDEYEAGLPEKPRSALGARFRAKISSKKSPCV